MSFPKYIFLKFHAILSTHMYVSQISHVTLSYNNNAEYYNVNAESILKAMHWMTHNYSKNKMYQRTRAIYVNCTH